MTTEMKYDCGTQMSGCTTADMLLEMSHELRTPLNAIIGLAQAMQLEALGPLENPRYREYLSDIDGCAQHLAELIGQIVACAQAECNAEAA